MQCTLASTAENALTGSKSVSSSTMLSTITVAPYTSMNASTEKIMRLSTTRPPSTTGCTARGCTRRVISRRACWIKINIRTILMPPPVEPALVATPDSNSMNTGANTGQAR